MPSSKIDCPGHMPAFLPERTSIQCDWLNWRIPADTWQILVVARVGTHRRRRLCIPLSSAGERWLNCLWNGLSIERRRKSLRKVGTRHIETYTIRRRAYAADTRRPIWQHLRQTPWTMSTLCSFRRVVMSRWYSQPSHEEQNRNNNLLLFRYLQGP